MIQLNRLIGASILSLLLTGCVLQERYHFSEEAADTSQQTVRAIMTSQILNPEASEHNRQSVLTGEDGLHAAKSLEQYRSGDSGESDSSSISIDMDN